MPISRVKKIKTQALEQSVKLMLESLGYDLSHQDIRDTPKRVARTLINELQDKTNLKKLFSSFSLGHDVMIALVNHKTYTRCPHHLERVILKVSIGYISNDRVIGLSKLARIADYYSKGLMLQEEIVTGIAEGLMLALKPKGVAVVAEGRHMCMMARGVETSGTVMTSKMMGLFLEDSPAGLAARQEFFFLAREEKK